MAFLSVSGPEYSPLLQGNHVKPLQESGASIGSNRLQSMPVGPAPGRTQTSGRPTQEAADQGGASKHVALGLSDQSTQLQLQTGNKFCTKYLLGSIALALIAALLLGGCFSGIIIGIGKDYGNDEKNITVYPGDTVPGGGPINGWQTSASLTPVKNVRNPIDVYVTNCSNVRKHSETKQLNSSVNTEVSYVPVIVESLNGISNYFASGTWAAMNITLSSINGTTAYLCTIFGFENWTRFFDVIRDHTTNISQFESVVNETRCHNITPNHSRVHYSHYKEFTTPGYYFIVLVSPPGQKLDSVQYNITLKRFFYDRADFIKDEHNCPLAHKNKKCYVTWNSTNDTCVMLYAKNSTVNYFNIIGVEALPASHYEEYVWPLVAVVNATLFIVALLGIGLCICRRRREVSTQAQQY